LPRRPAWSGGARSGALYRIGQALPTLWEALGAAARANVAAGPGFLTKN